MAHFFRPHVDCNYSDTSKTLTNTGWTRSTTVITFSATLGTLAIGDIVAVTSSSDTGALPNADYAVTGIGAGTFTVTGVDTGASSGTATTEAYVWYDASSSGNKQASKPSSSDAVTIVRQKATCSGNEAAASLTINSGSTLDISTYNLACTGLFDLAGTFNGGTSSGTGLTVGSINIAAGSAVTIVEGTKINCGGNWTEHASTIWTNTRRGTVAITGNGTMAKGAAANRFFKITQNAGVTTTSTAALELTRHTSETIINGIIALSGIDSLTIGASGTRNFTFGVDSNVTSGASCTWFNYVVNGATISIKTTPFSFAGTIRTGYNTTTINNLTTPPFNAPNAAMILNGTATTGSTRYISTGNHIYRSFVFAHGSSNDITLINNMTSLTSLGNVSLKSDAFTYNLTYTRGTGTWYLTGIDNTFNFQSKEIENVNVAVGAKYTEADAGFSCLTMTNNGELVLDSTKTYNMTDVSGSGTFSSINSKVVYVNYSGTNTFAGTLTNVILIQNTKIFQADGNFNDATKWNNGTLPAAGANIIINAVCTQTANDATVYGTVNITAGSSFDQSTYNFTCGAMTVNGTYKSGVSAGTGLTTAGLTVASGGKLDLQDTSKINNSGNYTGPDESYFINSNKGIYTQTANGSFTNRSTLNLFYQFNVNNGVSLTIATSSYCGGKNGIYIGGTIACGTYNFYMNSLGASSTFTMAATGDITGNGIIDHKVNAAHNFVWNRTTALSFAGEYRMTREGTSVDAAILSVNLANAFVRLRVTNSPAANFVPTAGTLKCRGFGITASPFTPSSIRCDVNNPNFEIGDGFDVSPLSDYTWVKGTGTITLNGTAGNINLPSQTVEDIIVNCPGVAKTVTANFSTDSLTITAGTFDQSTYNITTGAVNVTGTHTMGTSSDTGLTCSSFIGNSGWVRDWQTGSKINCSGDFKCHSTGTYVKARGTVVQTGPGTCKNAHPDSSFYSYIQNVGADITLDNDNFIASSSGTTSNYVELNARWILDNKSLQAFRVTTLKLGSGFQLEGTGIFYSDYITTLINDAETVKQTNWFGTFLPGFPGSAVRYLPTLNMPYANYNAIRPSVAVNHSLKPVGNVICKSYYSRNVQVGYTVTLDNSFYNGNITVNEDVEVGSATGTHIYIRGTGTYYLRGPSDTFKFFGNAIENVSIAAGAKYTEADNGFSCLNLNIDGELVLAPTATYRVEGTLSGSGVIKSSVPGTQVTIIFDSPQTVTNLSFQDIRTSVVNRINAKALTNTNLGNTNGIVFKDIVK